MSYSFQGRTFVDCHPLPMKLTCLSRRHVNAFQQCVAVEIVVHSASSLDSILAHSGSNVDTYPLPTLVWVASRGVHTETCRPYSILRQIWWVVSFCRTLYFNGSKSPITIIFLILLLLSFPQFPSGDIVTEMERTDTPHAMQIFSAVN